MKTSSYRQARASAVRPVKMVYRGGRGSHLDDECASHFSDDSGLRSGDLDHRERSDEMVHFVGLDVSVKATSVCVLFNTQNRADRPSRADWSVKWLTKRAS